MYRPRAPGAPWFFVALRGRRSKFVADEGIYLRPRVVRSRGLFLCPRQHRIHPSDYCSLEPQTTRRIQMTAHDFGRPYGPAPTATKRDQLQYNLRGRHCPKRIETARQRDSERTSPEIFAAAIVANSLERSPPGGGTETIVRSASIRVTSTQNHEGTARARADPRWRRSRPSRALRASTSSSIAASAAAFNAITESPRTTTLSSFVSSLFLCRP
jgi:hypothetical protein